MRLLRRGAQLAITSLLFWVIEVFIILVLNSSEQLWKIVLLDIWKIICRSVTLQSQYLFTTVLYFNSGFILFNSQDTTFVMVHKCLVSWIQPNELPIMFVIYSIATNQIIALVMRMTGHFLNLYCFTESEERLIGW